MKILQPIFSKVRKFVILVSGHVQDNSHLCYIKIYDNISDILRNLEVDHNNLGHTNTDLELSCYKYEIWIVVAPIYLFHMAEMDSPHSHIKNTVLKNGGIIHELTDDEFNEYVMNM